MEVVEDARAVGAAVDARRDEPGERRRHLIDDVDIEPHDLVLLGRLAAEGVDEGRVFGAADDLGHRLSLLSRGVTSTSSLRRWEVATARARAGATTAPGRAHAPAADLRCAARRARRTRPPRHRR